MKLERSPSSSKPRPQTRGGFALIVAISLLAFMVLLMVSLSTMVQTELRTTEITERRFEARQNAYYALQTAIGQLQKYAGADQRATAPATTVFPYKDFNELYDADPRYLSNDFSDSDQMWAMYRNEANTNRANSYLDDASTYLTPDEREAFDEEIRSWWNGSSEDDLNDNRNPYWTGVFDSSLRVDRASDPKDEPDTLNPQIYELGDREIVEQETDFSLDSNDKTKFGEYDRARPPVWLISGNEFFDYNPRDYDQQTYPELPQSIASRRGYPSQYLTPDLTLEELEALGMNGTDLKLVTLVGLGSATLPEEDAEGLDGRVVAPQIPIFDEDELETGYYAYWVGDESVKANFTVRDVTSENDNAYPNDLSPGTRKYRNRLQVPQRIGWGGMVGFSEALGNVNANNAIFERLITREQIELIDEVFFDDPEADERGPVQRNFHTATAYSRSLLTDQALGGFKWDLTKYVESNGNPTPVESGLGGVVTDDSIMADPERYLTNTQSNPGDPRFAAWGGDNFGFPEGPNNVDRADDYPLSETFSEQDPFLEADVELPWGMPTWGEVREWYGNTGGGTNDLEPGPNFAPVLTFLSMHMGLSYDPFSGAIHIHYLPKVVLWNPYDAPMASTQYDLDIAHGLDLRTFMVGTSASSTKKIKGVNASGPPSGAGSGDNPWTASGDVYIANTSETNGPFQYRIHTHIEGFNSFGDLVYLLTPEGGYKTVESIMKFSINTDFEPGQAKIFTLSNVSTKARGNWEPDDRLTLNNIFETDFPESAYWKLVEFDEVVPPGSNLRWHVSMVKNDEGFEAPVISFRFAATDHVITTANSFGEVKEVPLSVQIAGSSGFNNVSSFSEWRTLPNTLQFDNTSKAGPSLGNPDNPVFLAFQSWLEPFSTLGGSSMDQLRFHYPAFSRFNIGRNLSPHPLIEQMRRMDWQNSGSDEGNEDELTTWRAVKSMPLAASTYAINAGDDAMPFPQWDDAIVDTDDGVPGESAFTMLTIREDTGTPYRGVSQLALRKARRPDAELLSLGQLQQVNLARYMWQPSFVIGNSDATPYSDRAAIAGIHSREIAFLSQQSGVSGDTDEFTPPSERFISNNEPGYTDLETFMETKNAIDEFPPSAPGNAMMDLSYLLNENVWDRYFFSGLYDGDSGNSSDPRDVAREDRLNSRLRSVSNIENINKDMLEGIDTTAIFLENVGALNVNSTSVEAWKALLTAFVGLEFEDDDRSSGDIRESMPITRTLDPVAEDLGGGSIEFLFDEDFDLDFDDDHIGADNNDKDYTRVMNGFRYLTEPMIEELAKRIVDEVRLRGPFYSVADFVNRRLVPAHGAKFSTSPWHEARTDGGDSDMHTEFIDAGYDPFIGLHGLNGTLQRAINVSGINGGVNHPEPDDDDWVYSVNTKNDTDLDIDPDSDNQYNFHGGFDPGIEEVHTYEPTLRGHLDTEHWAGAPAGEAGQAFQGAPGFVTQGDLLSMIGPALTARGDTFLIRTYGSTVNPVTGEVEGEAWLEAVVQRTVKPVNPVSNDPNDPDGWRPDSSLGRQFEIVSLRWLDEDEI
ncbi:MAG: hypothetical protein ACFB21_08815 [Opitutales bacterium]